MIRSLSLLFACAAGGVLAQPATPAPAWSAATWHDEPAMTSSAHGWKAVVSLARGRLVYFGSAERDANLLFATATREDPAGWGGHRLWLGPQSDWGKIWPPPAAWESRGPESYTTADGQLRMVMPDAGDGWPRVTRTYRWQGATLACGAELSGGTKPAQVIQIMQVPPTNVIDAAIRPEPAAPAGYVLLPAGQTPNRLTEFAPPAQVTRDGATVHLRYIAAILKPGFRPETLIGHGGTTVLQVGRGAQSGVTVGEPDAGFLTQVYLGGHEPFIELEQLSPLFAAGSTARFEITLQARSSKGE